jgi:hypothetical protein
MTVCICVKVNECMVFAADSASSFGGIGTTDRDGNHIEQVYRHGNKLFQLHRQFPIMAMTCGLGNFGQASIAMLSKQFRGMIAPSGTKPLGSDYTIEEVVSMAHEFFLKDEFQKVLDADPKTKAAFEFWIGGYSSTAMFPELWKLAVDQGQVQEPVKMAEPEDTNIYVGGQPDPVFRLVRGFGWKLGGILEKNGITPDSHPELYKNLAPELYLPLVSPVMPVQDAIDLAEFLADVTKKVFRFRAVPEFVSGDIDIATEYENFRWIKRKHYYPSNLNVQVDHV